MEDSTRIIEAYVSDLTALLKKIDSAAVAEIVDLFYAAWESGRRVLFMGNGGSSSSVSHIVNDLQKNIALESGRPLKALCLADSMPLMMAWANDTEWSNVFAPQVECWAEPGDVVVGVSGSGNSMNVVHGIECANRLGAATVGLAGYDGGRLRSAAAKCIVVASDNMQRIEDAHMVILHMIFTALLERAKSGE